jgi:hypothetical protein
MKVLFKEGELPEAPARVRGRQVSGDRAAVRTPAETLVSFTGPFRQLRAAPVGVELQ